MSTLSILPWLFAFGIIAGAIGARKGEAITGFIAGVLLGPLGIILALISKGNRTPCPHCRSLIDPKASVCPKCTRPRQAVIPAAPRNLPPPRRGDDPLGLYPRE